MPRLRPFVPAFVFLLIGAVCLLAFQWAGSSIVDGVLQEPFYLVGLGSGCLVLGGLLMLVASIRTFLPRISVLELGRS